MVFENYMQPVALKRRPRVLAGSRVARNLPARTRARRWVRLILKDHQSAAFGHEARPTEVGTLTLASKYYSFIQRCQRCNPPFFSE